MLKLKNIQVTLGKNTALERKVLKNLNLEVKTGELVMLIGSNGAGKSTLFNLITGFLKPDSGQILLERNNITAQSQTLRSQKISIVLQDPKASTLENFTIFENLAFAAQRGKSRNFFAYQTLESIQRFKTELAQLGMGLEQRLDEPVANLSGGQRQGLSLIMALLADSDLLLLDEITAALDPKMAEKIMKLTNRLVRQKNKTCLCITHNMHHALEYGDRTIILNQGHIQKILNPTEKSQLNTQELAGFLNL